MTAANIAYFAWITHMTPRKLMALKTTVCCFGNASIRIFRIWRSSPDITSRYPRPVWLWKACSRLMGTSWTAADRRLARSNWTTFRSYTITPIRLRRTPYWKWLCRREVDDRTVVYWTALFLHEIKSGWWKHTRMTTTETSMLAYIVFVLLVKILTWSKLLKTPSRWLLRLVSIIVTVYNNRHWIMSESIE